MEEKNSQEDVTEAIETIGSDVFSRTEQHRATIDKIIVPQYLEDQHVEDKNYAVTYNIKDNSVIGWTINNEENGQPDVYFKLDQPYNIRSFVLYKKTLLFCYEDDNNNYRKYLF